MFKIHGPTSWLLIAMGILLFPVLAYCNEARMAQRCNPVLVTAGISGPKNLDPFQSEAFLTKNGTNFLPFSQTWSDIEPVPGQYNLQGTIINPLTLLVPRYPYQGVALVIKMIDTNARTMPPDLQNTSFNSPVVRKRFLAMLSAITHERSARRLTHILLGNEVDAYFSAHPEEVRGFLLLLKESIELLHQQLPGVKVATITTYDTVNNNLRLFRQLTQYSDFINYTYYPTNGPGSYPEWQMRPLQQTSADLYRMVRAAGNKPIAFTEIGYSAARVNGSSQEMQAQFVKIVFESLEPMRQLNRLEFITWSAFADYPPTLCKTYANQQGIMPSREFCGFLGGIGLREYATNTPRKAWDVFVSYVARWRH
jgi:hypothetical protein